MESPKPREVLFDYGAGLNLTEDELSLIREVEIIPATATFLGNVLSEVRDRRVQVYVVDGEPVRFKPMTGIEG